MESALALLLRFVCKSTDYTLFPIEVNSFLTKMLMSALYQANIYIYIKANREKNAIKQGLNRANLSGIAGISDGTGQRQLLIATGDQADNSPVQQQKKATRPLSIALASD